MMEEDFFSDELFDALENVKDKKYGEIIEWDEIIFDKKRGFLVWDRKIFNEITFVNAETSEYVSLYASANHEETWDNYEKILKVYKKAGN